MISKGIVMERKIDYRKTLNLPKTSFPLWVNQAKLQEKFLDFWEKNKIYQKIRKLKKGKKKFILHDGPPYANGNIHVGHILNKVLKDIVVKYKTMVGYDAPFIPGWDCHGLPIEHAVIDKAGLKKEKMSDLEVRKRCRDYALSYVKIQKKQFKDLGILGDWENPYLTLDPLYEATEYEVLSELVRKNLVFAEKKPVPWCASCETALAEAEIEYKEKKSPSLYVKFVLKDEPQFLSRSSKPKSLIVWTTTPWTLPANVALAFHPRLSYVAIETKKEIFILAEDLLSSVAAKVKIQNYKILKKFTGKDLVSYKALPILPSSYSAGAKESLIVLSDFVESDQGTGIVHIAPGHGPEDYQIGKKYHLPLKSPVDKKGLFTQEVKALKGAFVFEANQKIIGVLKRNNNLLASEEIIHSYPCCWRCKNPLIFRATSQWFININKIKEKALSLIKKVKWIPAEGQERMSSMLKEKPDWCISRQRKWGVAIPVVICQSCKKGILDLRVVKNVGSRVKKEGSDAWFRHKIEEFLPPHFHCPSCGGKKFIKGKDILDVWFDSGVSYLALIKMRRELPYPADLYLEGSDQHRGWFQSSLLANVGYQNKSPYRIVLTHGFTVDDKGNKMSKSLGNVVDPLLVQNLFGSEILRLWALSVDYRRDVSISSPKIKKGAAPILEQIVERYFKLRNTLRFLLGNLYDFDPQKEKMDHKDLLEIDRWILAELAEMVEKVNQYFENYEFYKAVNLIYQFSTVTLSAIYFDILKDRLYTAAKDSPVRKSAQNTLFILLSTLAKILAPIISFTAEEAWLAGPAFKNKEKSILLTNWPLIPQEYQNQKLMEKYRRLLAWRDKVNEKLDKARRQKVINSGLESLIEIHVASPQDFSFLKKNEKELPTFFIVSQVILKRGKKNLIKVKKAQGQKCVRCWKYSLSVDQDKNHPGLCQDCLKVIQ